MLSTVSYDRDPILSPYQRFAQDVILPTGDLLFRQHVARRFRELLTLQWQTEDEIRQYRLARLRELIGTVIEKVPYYRTIAKHDGLTRDSLSDFGVDDLAALPILDKKILRNQFEGLQVEGYSGHIKKMMSSGSTGTQTVVLTGGSCFDEVYATQLLFWSWGGFRLGASHLQTGMSLKRGTVRRLKDIIFRCSYSSAFDLSESELVKISNVLQSKKIRYLFGYASSVYVIARFLQDHSVNHCMDRVFTWGDSLFPHYRDLIENTFQCKVQDCYGLGEGLQCAAQCEECDALHEAMHGVIVEIVDGQGRPCDEGELGRVVVTKLLPGPLPLIRYDTGDVACFLGGDCPCGRKLKRMSRIQGRCTDIVTTPAGRPAHRALFHADF